MRKFAVLQNIEHYRRQLENEISNARRQMLVRLLDEEEAILAMMDLPHVPEQPITK
jgi:hypothetical protein